MENLAIEIQKVLNTFPDLDIRATEKNVHIMAAMMDCLAKVRDELMRLDREQKEQTKPEGGKVIQMAPQEEDDTKPYVTKTSGQAPGIRMGDADEEIGRNAE